MSARRSWSALVMLETQSGNWLCQTSVWPLTLIPLCCDKGDDCVAAREGEGVLGSVTLHFISFSGVTQLSSAAAVAA